jgi:hypothetical protein
MEAAKNNPQEVKPENPNVMSVPLSALTNPDLQ